mmetsp:Transcript_31057/g.51301  ORF Transcript_31057/g.51301 Transcript_31057/m.51301 type:complete len:209 (+) Transcript_31057:111-737(+)
MKPLSFAVYSTGRRNQWRNNASDCQKRTNDYYKLTPSTRPAQTSSSNVALFVGPPQQQIDVMSTEDVGVGIFLALLLALLGSYLQGRRNQSDIVLWNNNEDDSLSKDEASEGEVFGAESWKDISRPENYVLYNTEVRKKLEGKQSSTSGGDEVVRTEKRAVVIALLVLFVPVFSFEFFLTLSRQVICGGDVLAQSEWAQDLCSPHFNP